MAPEAARRYRAVRRSCWPFGRCGEGLGGRRRAVFWGSSVSGGVAPAKPGVVTCRGAVTGSHPAALVPMEGEERPGAARCTRNQQRLSELWGAGIGGQVIARRSRRSGREKGRSATAERRAETSTDWAMASRLAGADGRATAQGSEPLVSQRLSERQQPKEERGLSVTRDQRNARPFLTCEGGTHPCEPWEGAAEWSQGGTLWPRCPSSGPEARGRRSGYLRPSATASRAAHPWTDGLMMLSAQRHEPQPPPAREAVGKRGDPAVGMAVLLRGALGG